MSSSRRGAGDDPIRNKRRLPRAFDGTINTVFRRPAHPVQQGLRSRKSPVIPENPVSRHKRPGSRRPILARLPRDRRRPGPPVSPSQRHRGTTPRTARPHPNPQRERGTTSQTGPPSPGREHRFRPAGNGAHGRTAPGRFRHSPKNTSEPGLHSRPGRDDTDARHRGQFGWDFGEPARKLRAAGQDHRKPGRMLRRVIRWSQVCCLAQDRSGPRDLVSRSQRSADSGAETQRLQGIPTSSVLR